MTSIADHCIKRIDLGRELRIGPGFVIRERPVRDVPVIIYLDSNGKKTTRAAIAREYNVTDKCVNEVYTRNDNDWLETHEELRTL
tara:strand:- start:93 stop:347 length:255 start_codon:yes stop_codon:yes gene_type:complete